GVESKPASHWSHQYRRPESFLEVPPAAAVAFQQFVGLLRSPCARSIVGEIAWWKRFPQIEDGVDHRPARLHHVRALKQSLIANHAIMQQPLVAGAGLL